MNEVIIYKSDRNEIESKVQFENKSIWLTIDQMSQLFDKSNVTIIEYILNIFNEQEPEKESVVRKSVISDFSTKPTNIYNLDVINSVDYLVNSKQGTQFLL
jgi:hypothetical protein